MVESESLQHAVSLLAGEEVLKARGDIVEYQ